MIGIARPKEREAISTTHLSTMTGLTHIIIFVEDGRCKVQSFQVRRTAEDGD